VTTDATIVAIVIVAASHVAFAVVKDVKSVAAMKSVVMTVTIAARDVSKKLQKIVNTKEA